MSHQHLLHIEPKAMWDARGAKGLKDPYSDLD